MERPGAPRSASGVRGALMIAGTASGVGKSTVTAGLCRSLVRRGVRVAPFKAQNMSNHAAVTADGGEVGRAQAVQAGAARVELTRAMNPILLKPASASSTHVVVDGREVGRSDAAGWGARTEELRPVVVRAFHGLRSGHDVVIAEGAGGAAEINLLDRDLVNLPLARAVGMEALVVVDIERGGAFAAAHGTIGLLPPHLADVVSGFVVNGFRGDVDLLRPGLAELEARTGVPTLGVLPHLGRTALLGVEDSLDLDLVTGNGPTVPDPLRVAVVRLPHLANVSDLDPLRIDSGIELAWATSPSHLRGVDLIVLPGSRATLADLDWLRRTGLAAAITASDASILGICAGLQMLGGPILDGVESSDPSGHGLGLLPAETRFDTTKVVERRSGHLAGTPGTGVRGYRIHFGRVRADGDPLVVLDGAPGGEGEPDGAVVDGGRVMGTSLHGILDHDAARETLLRSVAERRGRAHVPSPVSFDDALDQQHERLADWIDAHLDLDAVDDAICRASPGAGPGW